MKITNEYLQSRRISKDFTIELDNGKEIEINKWVEESDNNCEAEWDFIEGKDIYDKLSEEEQEKVDDLIYDLEV